MSHIFGRGERTTELDNIFQQWSKKIWLEWFPLSPTKFHLSFKCFNSQEELCKYAQWGCVYLALCLLSLSDQVPHIRPGKGPLYLRIRQYFSSIEEVLCIQDLNTNFLAELKNTKMRKVSISLLEASQSINLPVTINSSQNILWCSNSIVGDWKYDFIWEPLLKCLKLFFNTRNYTQYKIFVLQVEIFTVVGTVTVMQVN